MFPLLPFPSPKEVMLFALVLSRVAGLMAALPLFGGNRLPAQVRIVTVLMLTLTCFPILQLRAPAAMPTDGFGLGLLLLSEVMIGLTLAFVTQAVFAAVEFCGQIVGMQMGFTIASVIDPTMGTQTQLMSALQTLLATMLFLSLNIHHVFIKAIIDSFALLPIGGWHLSGELISFFIQKTTDVFVMGIRLAAPVMVALLLSSVALGIMARAFPQMNVFMLSLPLNIGLGLLILGATLTIFFHVLEVSFGALTKEMMMLFRMMAKGG